MCQGYNDQKKSQGWVSGDTYACKQAQHMTEVHNRCHNTSRQRAFARLSSGYSSGYILQNKYSSMHMRHAQSPQRELKQQLPSFKLNQVQPTNPGHGTLLTVWHSFGWTLQQISAVMPLTLVVGVSLKESAAWWYRPPSSAQRSSGQARLRVYR